MLQLFIFIGLQIIINIIANLVLIDVNKKNIMSFAPLFFVLFLIIYSFFSWKILDYTLTPQDVALNPCGTGTLYVYGFLFQWLPGLPIVYFMQKRINKKHFTK
jgi:hypothetical protein